MLSGTLLAELSWYHTPSEENRKYLEVEARAAARGHAPLEAAAKEENAHRKAWVQATKNFEEVYAAYAASKTEEDRLAAGHALMALESASMYLKAAMTAREFIAVAMVVAA